jgi:peptidoglycan/LPS O-acetylase OafA/YrhL
MNKYSQIDFFRGFAALSVFISHFLAWIAIDNPVYKGIKWFYETAMKFFQMPGEGHPGVICFIVLSGFCIHLPYRAKKLEGMNPGFEVRKFFIRRFMRIFPLFLLACLLGVAALALVQGSAAQAAVEAYSGSTWADANLTNMMLKMSTLSEWLPWRYEQSYLGNAPLASVITEVWLYIFYPLFFLVLRRWGWKPIFAVTGLMYAFFPAHYIIMGEAYYSWWLFSLFNYYILWAWGAFLCEGTFGVLPVSRKTIYRIFWISLTGYVLGLLLAYGMGLYAVKYLRMLLLAGVFGTLLPILIRKDMRPAFIGIPGFLRPLYASMCRLGDFSYSLYAIHAPLVFAAVWAMSALAIPQILYGLYPLLILSLSLLTYRLIEMPTHQLAKKLTS